MTNREPISVKIEGGELREIEAVRKLPPVEVESSPSKPVWVRAADAERPPFQWGGEVRLPNGHGEVRFDLKVPGRRFQMETISAYARLPKGQFVPALQIQTTSGREGATHYLPLQPTGAAGTVEHAAGHHLTKIGADAQSVVTFIVPRSVPEGEGRVWLSVSGHLE